MFHHNIENEKLKTNYVILQKESRRETLFSPAPPPYNTLYFVSCFRINVKKNITTN
jgi:hypothetical protein